MQRYRIDISPVRGIMLSDLRRTDPDRVLSGELNLTLDQVDGITMSLYRILGGANSSITPYPNKFHGNNPFIGSGRAEENYDPHKRQETFNQFLYRITTPGRVLPRKYYLILQVTEGDTFSVYGFDSPEYIQGILSVCQWLRLDCGTLIKVYDDNGNRMSY